jgi:hypothetical protein
MFFINYIKTRQYMYACKWKPREHAKNPSFCISIELIAAESDLARKIEGMEKMLQKKASETCKATVKQDGYPPQATTMTLLCTVSLQYLLRWQCGASMSEPSPVAVWLVICRLAWQLS